MKSVDILDRIVEMRRSGRVGDDVMDRLLSGLEFVTTKGTGVFKNGMLDTGSGLVSFSPSGLSSVRVIKITPVVITTRITTVPPSGKTQLPTASLDLDA